MITLLLALGCSGSHDRTVTHTDSKTVGSMEVARLPVRGEGADYWWRVMTYEDGENAYVGDVTGDGIDEVLTGASWPDLRAVGYWNEATGWPVVRNTDGEPFSVGSIVTKKDEDDPMIVSAIAYDRWNPEKWSEGMVSSHSWEDFANFYVLPEAKLLRQDGDSTPSGLKGHYNVSLDDLTPVGHIDDFSPDNSDSSP